MKLLICAPYLIPRPSNQDPCWLQLIRYIHEHGGCTGSPIPDGLLSGDKELESDTIDQAIRDLMRLCVSTPEEAEDDEDEAEEGSGLHDRLLFETEGVGMRRLD